MRNPLRNDPRNVNGDNTPQFPISFTGDAIQYLSAPLRIDLNEWQWHEEYINGQRYCVITDRLSAEVQYPVGN